MAKKHFVLIHNAFHGKWIWSNFKQLLEKDGHIVTTFNLEASGDDPRQIETVASADDYSRHLLEVLGNIPDSEKVILVGNGFGGISAAIAMEKYPTKVELAVFLNALMPDTTHKPSFVIDKYMEEFNDWEDCQFGSYIIDNVKISKITLGQNFVKGHLFQDSSDEDYKIAMEKIRVGTFFPEPLAVRDKFTKQGYGSIPRVFISSQDDKGIPTNFQQWEMDNFPVTKVYHLEGDHSPMCSNPDGLLKIFHQIANTKFSEPST